MPSAADARGRRRAQRCCRVPAALPASVRHTLIAGLGRPADHGLVECPGRWSGAAMWPRGQTVEGTIAVEESSGDDPNAELVYPGQQNQKIRGGEDSCAIGVGSRCALCRRCYRRGGTWPTAWVLGSKSSPSSTARAPVSPSKVETDQIGHGILQDDGHGVYKRSGHPCCGSRGRGCVQSSSGVLQWIGRTRKSSSSARNRKYVLTCRSVGLVALCFSSRSSVLCSRRVPGA